MIVSTSGLAGAPAGISGPKWASGLFDGLKLPSGKTIAETNNEDLRGQFAKLGIPDAHTAGRDVLCQRYSEVLAKVFNDAGDAAVAAFLEKNRS
jgi:hypothetical protein